MAQLRLTIDGAYQQLMENRLIETVTSQFSTSSIDMLEVNMAFQRRRIAELQQRLYEMEQELEIFREHLLKECEDILQEQGVIEVK